MNIDSQAFDRIRKFLTGGLDTVEYVGLLVIAFATTVAMYGDKALERGIAVFAVDGRIRI